MTLAKASYGFFKMDPYYPKTLPKTFLNYVNRRQGENKSYGITSQIWPDLSFPNFPELRNWSRSQRCTCWYAISSSLIIFSVIKLYKLFICFTQCLWGEFCGMRCIDFCNEAIKILGTYFSYNSRIKEECNFLKIVSNVQSVLNLWQYRNLTLEGRIVVVKSLTISKIVFQALIAPVPTHVINALETI